MNPSRLQQFFARDWPIKIWFAGFSLFSGIAAAYACEPSPALLSDWHYLVLFVSAVLIAPVFGFFISLPVVWMVVGPLYHYRAKLNGAPFQVGDYVQILVGPHEGRVARIYSNWQGNAFRVELGPDAEKTYKDIFSPTKVLRTVIPDTRSQVTSPPPDN